VIWGNADGLVDRGASHEIKMKSQGPQRDDEKGRIVAFRPRVPPARNDNVRRFDPRRSPVEDVGKYARGEDENYRHRMVNNVLAFVVLVVIVYCGVWLANTMAQMRRDQDCVLTGRTNCSPISLPVTH
jgi:hypothetical protein